MRRWSIYRSGRGHGHLVSSVSLTLVILLLHFGVCLAVNGGRYSGGGYGRSRPPPPPPLLQSRRLDTINSWIKTIKQRSPQTNSISPSWNGKSPYRVIGVGGLPLQNEEADEVPPQLKQNDPVSARRAQFSPASPKAASLLTPKQTQSLVRTKKASPGMRMSSQKAALDFYRQKKYAKKPRLLPKRLPPPPLPKRRPPPLYDDLKRPPRRPKLPPPPGAGYPTSRRGALGGGGAGGPVGRRLPHQPTLYYDQVKKHYSKGKKPTAGGGGDGKIDFAKRPASLQKTSATSKLPSSTSSSSKNSRMELDDYNTRRPPVSASTAKSAIGKGYSRYNEEKSPYSNGGSSYKSSPTPPAFEPPKDFGPNFGSAFGENPFRLEENPDFPLQSFEGPPRVKPKFPKAASHAPPPRGRPPPPPSPSDLGVNLGFPPPKNRNKLPSSPRSPPPGSFRRPPPPPPPKQSRPDPSFKPPFYKPGSDYLSASPDGIFDEDERPSFKVFGTDGSPLMQGPTVDFEEPSRRPHRPPPPPGSRPPPPPRGRTPYSSGGRPPPMPHYTTERPIPTPGPEDFPEPPPTRPTPPPTHPTHPAPITHPPEHFLLPKSPGSMSADFVDSFFDGQSEGPSVKLSGGNPFFDDQQSIGRPPKTKKKEVKFTKRPVFKTQKRRYRPQPPPPHRDSFGSLQSQRPSPPVNFFPEENTRNSNPSGDPFSLFDDADRRRDPMPKGGPDSFQDTAFGGGGSSGGDPSLDDEEGFFAIPQSFPNLMSLGGNFESMKIRTKRSAEPQQVDQLLLDPIAGSQARRFPRRRRRLNRHHGGHAERDRSGYGQRTGGGNGGGRGRRRQLDGFGIQAGFWDDVETDFFSHTGPPFGQRHRGRGSGNSGGRGGNGGGGGEGGYGYRNQPQQQQRPYQERQRRPDVYYGNAGPDEEYRRQGSVGGGGGGGGGYADDRDNEILGSGNFDVIKGGTFYDPDTYYNTRYNTRPQNQYGGDFLSNFRDFADIKGDHLRRTRFNQY